MHHKVVLLRSCIGRFFGFKRYLSEISANKSHYAVLNVSPNAEFQDIKEAYLKLAKLYHPDLHPGNEEKHKIFLKINEAYSVLSKPQTKEEYDLKSHLQTMEVQHAPPNPWNVNYPLPPSTDSDQSVKTAYTIQASKMWVERTGQWQQERLHHQASRGLSLAPYSSTFYLNFRVYNRLSGQEVAVVSAPFYAALALVLGVAGYYCVLEYRHERRVSRDPSLIWEELSASMEGQCNYDTDKDFEMDPFRV